MIATAEQIRRSIAASRDPNDEVHRPAPIAPVRLDRSWRGLADQLAGLADDQFIDAKTLARRLNVAKVTVWRWTKSGALPSVRSDSRGRAHQYRVGDLRKALAR